MSRTLQFFLVAALLGAAQCCIFKYGSDPQDLVSGVSWLWQAVGWR